MFVMPDGLEVQERPERISKMAFYLIDKEPLIYLFIINSDFIPDEDGIVIGPHFAGVIFDKDRVKFFYRPSLIEEMPREELYFLIVHEAFHIFKKHSQRHADLKDAMIRNIAEDAVINHEINQANFTGAFTPKQIEGTVTIPRDFTNEFYKLGADAIETHRIYHWMKNKQQEQYEQMMLQPGNYIKMKGKEGESEKPYGKIENYSNRNDERIIKRMSKEELLDDAFGQGNKKRDKNAQTETQKIKDMTPVATGQSINNGCIPQEGQEVISFDYHHQNGKDEKEAEEAEVEKNFFTDKVINQAEKMEEKMNIQKSAGVGKGSLISRLKELNKPKINWKKEFSRKMNRFLSKNSFLHQEVPSFINYAWNPRSRYGVLGKYPIMQKKNLQTYMIFAVDTSGSVFASKEELEKLFTEVDAASKQLEFTNKGHVLTLQWDWEIAEGLKIYKSGDWKHFNVKGGGGTSPACIFRYLDNVFEEKNGRYVVNTGDVKFVTEDKKKLPFLCILTDGYFYGNMNEKSLGIYAQCPENILYFTRDTSSIYPKDNFVQYQ